MLQHGQTFNLFPFDTQKFKLVFESFRWRKKDIRYEWKNIGINPLIDFHDFKLQGYRNNTVNTDVSERVSGVFDANICFQFGIFEKKISLMDARVEFSFVRKAGYYYSILFTPLLLLSLLCLSAGWSPPQQRQAVLLSSNLFLLTYKIWFRATQLPPTPESVLAVDYIDLCWTVCLLCLTCHLVVQWRTGSTTVVPRHQEAFSLDESSGQAELVNPGCLVRGSFYHQSKVEFALLRVSLPLLFLVCQVGFWCRVAAITEDSGGLVTQ